MTTYTKFNDLNDSQKQEMTQEFIRDISIINQNTVVEYILAKSDEGCENAPFSRGDISNDTPTGQIKINGCYVELDEDGRDEKLEFYERLRAKADHVMANREPEADKQYKSTDNHCRLDAICDELESMDFDTYPEIYQWFECDSYLLYRLEERGECILDGIYWGRTCCGQSIILDSVMQLIAYDNYTEHDYNLHYVPECLSFLISEGV